MSYSGMTLGKKLAVLVVSLIPWTTLGVAVWAALNGHGTLFFWALILTGFTDSGLAVIYVPHVHDNPRLKDSKIVWIVLLGLPYVTVAPIYWAIYVLPEKPRSPEESPHPAGGAWYADPWGEAPFRWWDGRGWTDWVTGPPGES
jgi:hypothetical protein